MTDNLVIKGGLKRLTINGDPNNVLEFDPSDIVFAERFYALVLDFDKSFKTFKAKADKLDKETIVGETGIPTNMEEKLKLSRESCVYMRDQIDTVFGDGISQRVFGDGLSMLAFEQFFEGVAPFIKQSRANKVGKYIDTPSGKKRVMK